VTLVPFKMCASMARRSKWASRSCSCSRSSVEVEEVEVGDCLPASGFSPSSFCAFSFSDNHFRMEKVVSMDWPNEEAMASVTVNLVSPCASDKIDAIVVALGTTERSGGGEEEWWEEWWEEEWWVGVRETEREKKSGESVSERERPT
jgi:hypothetical protein